MLQNLVYFALAGICCILGASKAINYDFLEGLPGQIVNKLRDNRESEKVDLLEELQQTYIWANEQSGWSEFSFPVQQSLQLPMIGDVALYIDRLNFGVFEAVKDGDLQIVERTNLGYRIGLFNIEAELAGIEISTFGFFSSTHSGNLTMKLDDCFIEIVLIEGQSVPDVYSKIGHSRFSFKSHSVMTELMMSPLLMLSQETMVGTIESVFSYYMTQFWLPIDMEFYIAVAADALLSIDPISGIAAPKDHQRPINSPKTKRVKKELSS